MQHNEGLVTHGSELSTKLYAITQRAKNDESNLAELEVKYKSLCSTQDHEVQSAREEEMTHMQAQMISLVEKVDTHLEAQTQYYNTGLLYAQAKGNISLVYELARGKVMDFQEQIMELSKDCDEYSCELSQPLPPLNLDELRELIP